MKKVCLLFLLITCLLILKNEMSAQCNTNSCFFPVPSVNAQDACVLDNPGLLDCYFGATTDDPPVSFPPSWCAAIHNNHWFAFIADSPTAVFEICTYGCAQGSGIQAAVLSTLDCITFAFASACLGNIPSGSCATLTANGLIPGDTYYICIDGSAGAVCDYSINGVNPTISGPTANVCLPSSTLVSYSTNTVSDWTINPPTAGNIIGNPTDTNISIQWLEPGAAEVCAQSLLCPNAPNLCIPIIVGETVESDEMVDMCQGYTVQCAGQTFAAGGTFPVTLNSYLGCDSVVNCMINVIPTVTTIENVRMCPSGSVSCAGVEFFGPGTFPVTLPAYQGCDSIVRCVVTVIPPYISPTRFVNLCGPSDLQVCDEIFSETGIYSTTCTGFLGCDSIITTDLAVLSPTANIAPPAILDCGANAVITLNGSASTMNSATGGVTLYSWSGPGIIGANNTSMAQVNLPGDYCLIVQHGRGGVYCPDTACVTVQASALAPTATATGGSLNCSSSQTMLTGNSTTPGVTYTWIGPGINAGNQFQQNPTVDSLGTYILTVLNPVNGCSTKDTVMVIGDLSPPAASAVGGTITCLQTSITIDGITDAASPSWNWEGPDINSGNQTQENPNVAQAGTYSVTVTNTANGCTNTASVAVNQNNTNPTALAGPNDTLTCTVPNVSLQGSGDAGGQAISFSWTGPNGFVSDTTQPSINQSGTYILTVLNTQNSCMSMDSVSIISNQTLPTANAGADATINCVQPSVTLPGAASSNGANFSATWSGPGINPGNINLYNPTVDLPGTYGLLITNITNGCTATDTVVVNIDTSLPTATAGADQQLTCSNPNGVMLDGNADPINATYFWSGPGIGVDNETDQNPNVTQAGIYNLVVTNTTNGCTATDEVIVTQDADVPLADAGPDQVLNCSITTVNFDGTGSSAGPGIIYTWNGPGILGPNTSAQSPTNLNQPGIYNLMVTNTNNDCVNTDVVVIQMDTLLPIADAGNALVLNCFNNATDTLDASGSSLGSEYSLLWAGPGINIGNQNLVRPVINNEAGMYSLTVTNTENTCTATDQVDILLDLDPPTADAGTGQSIDCVITTALIGGSSSTGANFIYLWNGPGIDDNNETLETPTIDEPGLYTILVTNTLNGCTASSDVLVNSNAVLPTSLAGSDGLLTCANPTAVLDGSGSSAGTDFQMLWTGPGINAGNETQTSPGVSVQGTYILTITNIVNSCVTSDTVFVDENIAVPVANAGQNLILDCQTTIVSINGSLSEIGPNIVYNWSGPGINVTNQNLQNPVVDQPGIYDMVVTDNENGCSATDQVQVVQDTVAPIASAGADGLITCAQLTQLLDGSGSSVGAFIVYIWDGPGINSNNFQLQSPTINASGTYTVTVTNNQNHCSSTDVVFVDIDNISPVISAGPERTLTCALTTAQLDGTGSATGANISFLWGGPGIVPGDEISSMPAVVLPGIYQLTLTDANSGCTSEAAVNVGIDTLPPLVFTEANAVLNCANAGTGVTLSSAGSDVGANFEYLWSGPGITSANETLADPTVLLPGTYTLLIINTNNGCDATEDIVVDSQQEPPTADAGLPQVITCTSPNATLDGSGSSTTSGTLQFFWDGPGINSNNQNSVTPLVLLSGDYSLTVTNIGTGCTSTSQVLVSLDNLPPTAVAASDTITCLELVSTVTVSSSLAGSTYFWTGPDVQPNSQANPTIQVDLAGLYEVTVTAPNGCTTSTSTFVIEDDEMPQGTVLGSVLNCLNNSSTTISGEVFSPAGATFTWTGPGIGTMNTPTITVTQAGTYTFTIFAPNGCERPFTAEVLADFAQPTVSILAPEKIDCNTTEVTINGTASSSGPNYSSSWMTTNGQFVSGTNTLTPLVDQAGNYQLTIVNSLNGCSATSQVEVLVDSLVPTGFDLTVKNIKCFGDVNGSISVNGVLGGAAPYIFFLSGNTGSSNNHYTGLAAGQYVLSVEDANGCQLDTTITISEPGQLLVELGPDIEVSLGDSATVTAQIASTVGISSVEWNYAPGCDSLSPDFCETFNYRPLGSYRHSITVTDLNGCTARDVVLVIVQKNGQVFVPNIFNPNSNLNFSVGVHVGVDVAKINYFNIFDRWGDQVFSLKEYIPLPGATPDAFQSWDGNVRGDKGQAGVYVWYCEVVFIDGQTKLFKGDVTLIR